MGVTFTRTVTFKPSSVLPFLENRGTVLQLQKVGGYMSLCSLYQGRRKRKRETYPGISMLKNFMGFSVNALLQLLLTYVSSASRSFEPRPHRGSTHGFSAPGDFCPQTPCFAPVANSWIPACFALPDKLRPCCFISLISDSVCCLSLLFIPV